MARGHRSSRKLTFIAFFCAAVSLVGAQAIPKDSKEGDAQQPPSGIADEPQVVRILLRRCYLSLILVCSPSNPKPARHILRQSVRSVHCVRSSQPKRRFITMPRPHRMPSYPPCSPMRGDPYTDSSRWRIGYDTILGSPFGYPGGSAAGLSSGRKRSKLAH